MSPCPIYSNPTPLLAFVASLLLLGASGCGQAGCLSDDTEDSDEAIVDPVSEPQPAPTEARAGVEPDQESAGQSQEGVQDEESPALYPRYNREDMATLARSIIDEKHQADEGEGCPSMLELDDFQEFARFLTADATRRLVANRWAQASQRADGDHLDDDILQLEWAVDDSLCLDRSGAETALLSIIFEEMAINRPVLRPPGDQDHTVLVDHAAQVMAAVVENARALAALDGSTTVADDHVKDAFRQLQQQRNWRTDLEIPDRSPVDFYGPDYISLTQRFWRGDDVEPAQAPDQWRGLSLRERASQELGERLQKLAARIAEGKPAMRPDNFVLTPRAQSSSTRRYLDPIWTRNTLAVAFPHVMAADDSLRVYLAPHPGFPSRRALENQTFVVPAAHLESLDDSDFVRQTLIDALDASGTVLDPLVWDYTAAHLSRYLAYLLERSHQHARQQRRDYIDRVDILNTSDAEETFVLSHTSSMPAGPRSPTSTRHFRDASEEAGFPTALDTLDGTRNEARFDHQRVMGSGLAVGDLTDNGYPDFYISGEGLNRLYINRGQSAPGTFIDATEQWGLPEDFSDVRAPLFVDFTGDGKLELLLVRSDNPSKIYAQDGGQFVDVTDDFGLRTRDGAHTAAVADFEGNGRLDLYIGYYGNAQYHRGDELQNVPDTDGRNGPPNQLWTMDENRRFRLSSRRAGVDDRGWTLATSAVDINRNGRSDLVVVNDFGPNKLYKNLGDGTFDEVGLKTRSADSGPGMNASFTDLDGDGRWDFYVSNIDMLDVPNWFVDPHSGDDRDMRLVVDDQPLLDAFVYEPGNRLFANGESADGEPLFDSVEHQYFGDHNKGWCWGAFFFDYDLDGRKDLYLTNGFVTGTGAANQKNQFYRRTDEGFELQATDGVETFAGNSRSVVAVDVDRNGRLDLLVNNYRQPPVLLKNNHQTTNKSVQIKLTGPPREPSAVGAIVELQADAQRQMGQVIVGSGYLAQEDSLLTFGAGQTSHVDVTVFWPDGQQEKWPDQPTGQVLELTYGDGTGAK